MNPLFPSANGASSLSPGHRPGSGCRNAQRPVGPRYVWRDVPPNRAPVGRMGCVVARNPARRAGLRNHGPLARNTDARRIAGTRGFVRPQCANGASSLNEGQRPGAHRASLAELDALFATLQHRAFRGEP